MTSPHEVKYHERGLIDHREAVVADKQEDAAPGQGARFWLVFGALCLSLFVSALDAVSLLLILAMLPCAPVASFAIRFLNDRIRVYVLPFVRSLSSQEHSHNRQQFARTYI